jgi:hypothetical protein
MLSQEQYFNGDEGQLFKQEAFFSPLMTGLSSGMPSIFDELTLQQDILPHNGLPERPLTYESSNESNSSPERTESRSSENEIPIPENIKTTAKYPMSVTVLHKPRGSKGIWEKVLNGDVLRVTREKGKRLKIQCQSDVEFNAATIQISIIDLMNAETFCDGVAVERYHILEEGNKFTVELEVKLYVARRRLQLTVCAASKTGDGYVGGFSVPFKTTSSGGAMKASSSTPSPTQAAPLSASTAGVANDTQSSKTKSDTRPSVKKRKISQATSTTTEQSQTLPPPAQKDETTASYFSSPYSDSLHTSTSCPNAPNSSSIPTQSSYLSSSEYPTSQTEMFPPPSQPILQPPVLPVSLPAHNVPPQVPALATSSSLAHPSGMLPNEIELNDFRNHVIPGSLSVTGVVRAKAFYQLSDIRLKCDIEDLADAVQIVMSLQGKKYRWKDGVRSNENGGKKVIGFIAQQVKDIVPEAVHEEEDGYLSVNYEVMVPILVEAFKQHLQEYKDDRDDIKRELSALKERLDAQGAETNAEIQKIAQDITEIVKNKKTSPPATANNSLSSGPQRELSKEQPTTIPATTKETSASTATKATLSKPTKKQTTKRSRCVDRYFGGRVSYLILLLTAIFLFVAGLALISLNIGLNAGNFSSSQVASLHLVIISKNIADFSRRDSQRQPPQSNKNKVEFDDIRDIRDLPPQAVGNTPPISIPQNPTDYTTYVVLYVVGASLSFIGLILGIIVIVLIVRAKKRLDESSQV